MNGYNNYYGSQNPQNQPQQPQPQQSAGQYSYSSQGGWEYYDGAWHPRRPAQPPYGHSGMGSQQPPAPQANNPRKGGGKKAMGAAALVLACALAGFGGGYAANMLSGDGTTVVYKAAETGVAADTTSTTGGAAVSDVAAMAGESVVSIVTENMVTDFFTGGRIVSGAGSGVIISQDGYIITNNHVVSGAQNMKVTLPDGSEHDAVLVGTDPTTDVAVIKINVEGLVPAVTGDSDSIQVGEFCIAIGNPMGTLGGTVTDGIISALNREISIDGEKMNLLQMSAAVSPGNSGGGLFNSRGELVGIVNAKSGGDDTEGLGFAIPVNTAVEVAAQLIENGVVTGRPALGVSVVAITDEQAAAEAGVGQPGVYVAAVNTGGAAEKAGVLVGDQVLAADGQEVLGSDDLGNIIKQKEVGDSITLTLLRDGTQLELTATLGEKSQLA